MQDHKNHLLGHKQALRNECDLGVWRKCWGRECFGVGEGAGGLTWGSSYQLVALGNSLAPSLGLLRCTGVLTISVPRGCSWKQTLQYFQE